MNKKNIQLFLILSTLILTIFSKSIVCAIDIKSKTVSTDKVWRVNFNKKVYLNNSNKKNISVEDKNGVKIKANITLSQDNKAIIIYPPKENYLIGGGYKIKINKKFKNIYGESLKQDIEFNFNISNIESNNNILRLKRGDKVQALSNKNYIINNIDSIINNDKENIATYGWNTFSYYYDDDIKNEGIAIESDNSSKELKIPINFNGYYAIYVGYVSDSDKFSIRVRSKEDIEELGQIFNVNTNECYKNDHNTYIKESFIGTFNFIHNGDISILPLENNKAKIAYIKLKALNEEEKSLAMKNEKEDENTVIYDNDGYSNFFWGTYEDSDSLKLRAVDELNRLNVGEINWCMGTTGLLTYNSKYAGYPYEGSELYDIYIRDGDKRARKGILGILASGRSPLEIVVDRGKEKGIKVNASLRMNTFYKGKELGIFNGSMYEQYKDCLQNNSNYMSYYYYKYREYIFNVIMELYQVKDIYGLTLDFCRYPNVMGSEATEEEKISIMNDFMRNLKVLSSKNIKLSVRIPYKEYKKYGLDVETWIKEGLIDRIIPSSIGYEDFYDVSSFVDMVKGTKVQVYSAINADIGGHDITKEEEELIKYGLKFTTTNKYLNSEQYLERAYDLYESDVNGIFLFNVLNNTDGARSVPDIMNILGNKTKVEKWHYFQYPCSIIENKIRNE